MHTIEKCRIVLASNRRMCGCASPRTKPNKNRNEKKRKENQIWNLCRFKRGYPFSQYCSNTNIYNNNNIPHATQLYMAHKMCVLLCSAVLPSNTGTERTPLAAPHRDRHRRYTIHIITINRNPCADFGVPTKDSIYHSEIMCANFQPRPQCLSFHKVIEYITCTGTFLERMGKRPARTQKRDAGGLYANIETR